MLVYTRNDPSDIQEVEGILVNVYVNEMIRKCATFLYEDCQDEETGEMYRRVLGTAFLVAKSLDDSDEDVKIFRVYPERYVCYLVTAGHVIANRKTSTVYVRLNKASHPSEAIGFEDIPTAKDDWVFHVNPDETDVAVYHLKVPFLRYGIMAMPYATLMKVYYERDEGIGSGDEVFFVGLFTGHQGSKQVEPIIRFGHISLMKPYEKVEVYLRGADKAPTPISAYLVEARSHGGVSGSPVFIYWPPLQRESLSFGGIHRFRQQPLPLIFGLVFGQYQATYDAPDGEDTINSGIAIVIPAEKIRETLMQKKLRTKRKEMRETTENRSPPGTPKPVAGSVERSVEFTAHDMLGALQKASRKHPVSKKDSD